MNRLDELTLDGLKKLEQEVRQKTVHALRVLSEEMTPEERVSFWNEIQQGYCPHCGEAGLPCFCKNDE